MRIDDHARDGVMIYWDNFSEVVPDNKSQRFDFEGYQLWRADDWTRPLGTSVATGPPTELWSALFQADIFNFFGEDVGLERFFYEPLVKSFSASELKSMLDKIRDDLLASPEEEPPCPFGVSSEACDTLKALARWDLGLDGGRKYYRYLDRSVHLGAPYFYSVIAFDHGFDENRLMTFGLSGDPASNFAYVEPKSASQPPHSYSADKIYVVPNPVTKESLAGWALGPTNADPTGVKLEFRNLPPSRGVIRVYTLSGDLVKDMSFDGTTGVGSVSWDLVSRNGQTVTSGVYLYSIEFEDSRYGRVIKKFTVIQ
jgi:hypothetical protein